MANLCARCLVLYLFVWFLWAELKGVILQSNGTRSGFWSCHSLPSSLFILPTMEYGCCVEKLPSYCLMLVAVKSENKNAEFHGNTANKTPHVTVV